MPNKPNDDALITFATHVLLAKSGEMLLAQLTPMLYEQFGKDECKAIMHGGAGRWLEQHPRMFRVRLADAGVVAGGLYVSLVDGWGAASNGEDQISLNAFKSQVLDMLATGEVPLGQLLNRHRQLYGLAKQFKLPPSTGLRALLSSDLFAGEVELAPWAESPNMGELVARLVPSGAVASNSDSSAGTESLPTPRMPTIHVVQETPECSPATLPQSVYLKECPIDDDISRAIEALVRGVANARPDRPADIVTRHTALGMLFARKEMIALEARANAAEERANAAEERANAAEARAYAAAVRASAAESA